MSGEKEHRPWLEIPVPNYIPLEDPEKLNPNRKGSETWQDPKEEEEKRVIIIQL